MQTEENIRPTELEILEKLLQLADKNFPSPITYTDEDVSITVKWNSSADIDNPQTTLGRIMGAQPNTADWNLPEVTATFTNIKVADPLILIRNIAWQLVSETTNNDAAAEQITTQFGHFDNIPEDQEEPAAVITVRIIDWFS